MYTCLFNIWLCFMCFKAYPCKRKLFKIYDEHKVLYFFPMSSLSFYLNLTPENAKSRERILIHIFQPCLFFAKSSPFLKWITYQYFSSTLMSKTEIISDLLIMSVFHPILRGTAVPAGSSTPPPTPPPFSPMKSKGGKSWSEIELQLEDMCGEVELHLAPHRG